MGVIALAFAPLLPAAYSNLIAPANGGAIYFQLGTTFVSDPWFAIRVTDSGAIVEHVNEPLADISDSGMVFASASFAYRYCGAGATGSTAFSLQRVQNRCGQYAHSHFRPFGPNGPAGLD